MFSDRPVHEALVTKETFEQVRARLASRGPRSSGRTVRGKHPYALTGMVFHDSCGRRMQGTWNHGRAHYRCRFPAEYALANQLDHPGAVYLREDQLVGPIDEWLAEAYAPERVQHDLRTMGSAPPDREAGIDVESRALAVLEQKLGRYRAALEAGADPSMVAE